MSKKKDIVVDKPIVTNLIRQNCFLRDVVSAAPTSGAHSPDTYISLDEVTTSSGIALRETVKDYEITPDYVQSFVDSSDYRLDPVNAVANGHSRSNLGDISSVQEVASLDTERARALYQQLSKLFSNSAAAPAAAASSDSNQGGDK